MFKQIEIKRNKIANVGYVLMDTKRLYDKQIQLINAKNTR